MGDAKRRVDELGSQENFRHRQTFHKLRRKHGGEGEKTTKTKRRLTKKTKLEQKRKAQITKSRREKRDICKLKEDVRYKSPRRGD